MYNAIRAITSQKYQLGSAHLKHFNDKYIKLFNKRTVELYQLGYFDTPSLFDMSEFLEVFLKENLHLRSYFVSNITAKMVVDTSTVKLAILNEEDSFIKDVLIKLYDICYSKDMLDLVYVMNRVSKISDFDPRLYCHGRLETSRNNINILGDCFVEFVSATRETKKSRIGVSVVKALCLYTGVSEDDYNNHVKTGNAFFLSGITAEDELLFIPDILSGKINTDGVFGDGVRKSIEAYYNELSHDENVVKTGVMTSFSTVIYTEAGENYVREVTEISEEMALNGYHPYAITETTVTYVNDTFYQLSDATRNVGNYILEYNGGELDEINRLYGYTGEFISKQDVDRAGLSVSCLPINLYVGGKKRKYYPIQFVRLSGSGNSLIPRVLDDYYLEYSDLDRLLWVNGVASIGSLDSKVRDMAQTDKKIVTSLVHTMICVDCEYSEEFDDDITVVNLPKDLEIPLECYEEAMRIFKEVTNAISKE